MEIYVFIVICYVKLIIGELWRQQTALVSKVKRA